VGRRGYVHALYEHLAACDLAIVQGGGTTTTELMVLRRPFLYFPLEGHFEQRRHVAGRLARHGAGVQLEYGKTTPERLAEAVLANIGREVCYRPWPPKVRRTRPSGSARCYSANSDVFSLSIRLRRVARPSPA
jgi:UDP-N-acetylglucosamine:LPS N-acetylglucosamine transferase